VASFTISNNSNKTIQDRTNKNNKGNNKTQEKMDQRRLHTLKHELLKISLRLQTEFAAETHLAEGQRLEEQANAAKLGMFRAGTRMPAVSSAEEEHLMLVKVFIKTKHRSREACSQCLRISVFGYSVTKIFHILKKDHCGEGLQIFLACSQVYWRQ
jgi:hypothetical protein